MMDKMDKCPFCKAAKDGIDKHGNTQFSCRSWIDPHCMSNECQSDRCKDRQISQLKARNKKLERLRQVAEQFNNYNPDRSMKDALSAALKDLEVPADHNI